MIETRPRSDSRFRGLDWEVRLGHRSGMTIIKKVLEFVLHVAGNDSTLDEESDNAPSHTSMRIERDYCTVIESVQRICRSEGVKPDRDLRLAVRQILEREKMSGGFPDPILQFGRSATESPG